MTQNTARLSFRSSTNSFKAQRRIELQKQKNRAGTKSAREARLVMGIADSMEKDVARDLNKGISNFKRKVNTEEIATLLEQGKFDDVVKIIPWEEMPEDLQKLSDAQRAALIAASGLAIRRLITRAKSPAVFQALEATLNLTATNPRTAQFIQQNIGALIVGIQAQTRRVVQGAIFRAFDQSLTPKRAAKLIRDTIGLTEFQANRVFNRGQKEFQDRDRLEAKLVDLDERGLKASPTAIKTRLKLKGLTDSKIENRMIRAANKAQSVRALTIARTELISSVNQGQLDVWGEAANQGLIDTEKAVKQWVTVADQDRSDICRDLDGQKRGLNDTFFVEQTGESVTKPPAHPNCRSSLVLEDFD